MSLVRATVASPPGPVEFQLGWGEWGIGDGAYVDQHVGDRGCRRVVALLCGDGMPLEAQLPIEITGWNEPQILKIIRLDPINAIALGLSTVMTPLRLR